MTGRLLRVVDPMERENLAAFVSRAVRLDPAAVLRLRTRPDGLVDVWVATGFDVLAVRACAVESDSADTTVAAEQLLDELATGNADLDPGYCLDSAWRGALPPMGGFAHVDNVPARALVELARRGVELSDRHGGGHPPSSLLNQEVVDVAGRGGVRVGIPMRVVFALQAMGFIPTRRLDVGDDDSSTDVDVDVDELVRVRATATWLRLDARYGSIAKRRYGELPLLVR